MLYLSNKIIQPKNVELTLPDTNPKTIFFEATNCYEIYKIMHAMKIRAGGIDSINIKILKTLSNLITLPLEHIFNLSIGKAIWPTLLKAAEVVPIYKAGISDIKYFENFSENCL